MTILSAHQPTPAAAHAAVLGALVAGGQSRRFGSPKLLAELRGEPLLVRVQRALRAAVPRVVLISHLPEAAAVAGVPARPDHRAGHGALGGVETALLWARELGCGAALCVGCDTPFLPTGLLRALAGRAAERLAAEPGAGWVVAPESTGPLGWEPLCAAYPVAALPVVSAALDAGRRSLGALAGALPLHLLPLAAVRAFGEPEVIFHNVNTQADLNRAHSLDPHTRG